MKSGSLNLLSRIDAWRFPKDAFGKSPRGTAEDYVRLFNEARKREFEETLMIEDRVGYSLPETWLSELALHTQVVLKESRLNWQHGRLLYAFLREYLEGRRGERDPVTILETGTARGFSSVCMGKAIVDSESSAVILTIDSIPHDERMFWNCLDDFEGKKSRRELLSRWPQELSRVVFLQLRTPEGLARIGQNRVGFAFLDAQHTYQSVMAEFTYVEARQQPGDVVFFDDVTQGTFDGVVRAVKAIEEAGTYEVEYLGRQNERGYAIARRQ